MGQKSKIINF